MFDIENALYNYIRDAYKNLGASVYCPLTDSLIIQLVGIFGFDILANAKLIEPTKCPGQWVLCGYTASVFEEAIV